MKHGSRAILAHELGDVALGRESGTDFAISDRVPLDDEQTLNKFRMARTRKRKTPPIPRRYGC
jgi:hypothetical protein